MDAAKLPMHLHRNSWIVLKKRNHDLNWRQMTPNKRRKSAWFASRTKHWQQYPAPHHDNDLLYGANWNCHCDDIVVKRHAVTAQRQVFETTKSLIQKQLSKCWDFYDWNGSWKWTGIIDLETLKTQQYSDWNIRRNNSLNKKGTSKTKAEWIDNETRIPRNSTSVLSQKEKEERRNACWPWLKSLPFILNKDWG